MRRTLPKSPVRLARSRRRSARRAGVFRAAHEAPKCGSAASMLQISMPGEVGDVRYRAALAPADRSTVDAAVVSRAYTDFVACAGGTATDGDASLRQATWTERGGAMITEVRSATGTLSSLRVAQLVLPIVRAFVDGTLEAGRILSRHVHVGMTLEVSTAVEAGGGKTLRLTLRGTTEVVEAAFVPSLSGSRRPSVYPADVVAVAV